jgi:hypothetical protein
MQLTTLAGILMIATGVALRCLASSIYTADSVSDCEAE